MNDHFYAVIMAGGGGTRLWPLSRRNQPKQMLSLLTEHTMFQEAVNRLDGLFPKERIYVVTTAEMAEAFQLQCPELPKTNFILEPRPRGTASVVGLAATVLQQLDKQAVFAVLTSDHHIGNNLMFKKYLQTAYQAARQNYLVTLGIKPTFPATGFGYIQSEAKLDFGSDENVYRVTRFKEKPDRIQAEEMLAAGHHTWNSGMFIWQAETILDEFKRQMPNTHTQLQEIAGAWNTLKKQAVLDKIWSSIEVTTIDYGIMEHAERVAVVEADNLEWNDVGSWESLYGILQHDENGNVLISSDSESIIALETTDSLIHAPNSKRLIVTIGLEDLVIVETEDILMISRKDQSQKVRQVVNYLKDHKPEHL